MGTAVAGLPQRVKPHQDDVGDRRGERVSFQQVAQMRVVRPWQTVPLIQLLDELLGEAPQFDGGALRIPMGVLLSEPAQVRQERDVRTEKLEVQRLHERFTLSGKHLQSGRCAVVAECHVGT